MNASVAIQTLPEAANDEELIRIIMWDRLKLRSRVITMN